MMTIAKGKVVYIVPLVMVMMVNMMMMAITAELPTSFVRIENWQNTDQCDLINSPSSTAVVTYNYCSVSSIDPPYSSKATISNNVYLAYGYRSIDCSGEPIPDSVSFPIDQCVGYRNDSLNYKYSTKYSLVISLSEIYMQTFYSDSGCLNLKQGPQVEILNKCGGQSITRRRGESNLEICYGQCGPDWRNWCINYTIGHCNPFSGVFFRYDVLPPDTDPATTATSAGSHDTTSTLSASMVDTTMKSKAHARAVMSSVSIIASFQFITFIIICFYEYLI